MIECCLLYKVMVPSMTSVLHEGHIYYTILGHDESTDQEQSRRLALGPALMIKWNQGDSHDIKRSARMQIPRKIKY